MHAMAMHVPHVAMHGNGCYAPHLVMHAMAMDVPHVVMHGYGCYAPPFMPLMGKCMDMDAMLPHSCASCGIAWLCMLPHSCASCGNAWLWPHSCLSCGKAWLWMLPHSCASCGNAWLWPHSCPTYGNAWLWPHSCPSCGNTWLLDATPFMCYLAMAMHVAHLNVPSSKYVMSCKLMDYSFSTCLQSLQSIVQGEH